MELSGEENEAIIDFEREVEYGRILESDILLSLDTGIIILDLINKQQKEIKKYKRYFKLAISDLQSEGYMQMPYKNIEKYYSKREDIV